MKYQDCHGNIYEGDVVVSIDGRIRTGKTLTRHSIRVFPIEEPEVVSAPVSKPAKKKKAKSK